MKWKRGKLFCGFTSVAVLGFSLCWAAVAGASSVNVNVERTPGISQTSDGAVKLGTVHITEDQDLPNVMMENDFLELIVPEGVIWSSQTEVYFNDQAYTEGYQYSFSGDRYLNITLSGVTGQQDQLTVIPYVELDDVAVGNLYISIQGDLIDPNTSADRVAAAQRIHYAVAVESKGKAAGTADTTMELSPFVLQEACAGSLQMDEDIQITLPQGFVFTDSSAVAAIETISGSQVLGTPVKKQANRIEIPVTRNSGEAVRVQITLQNVYVPENFSGEVPVYVQGQVFEETVIVGNIAAPAATAVKTEPQPSTDIVAEKSATGIFWIDAAQGFINGRNEPMTCAPYIREGRSYLPVRYVAYALGMDASHITWDAVQQCVTIAEGNTTVQLTIGSRTMMVNGTAVEMDTAPEIYFDYTMLPARWVVEAFGGSIEWTPEPPMIMIYAP